MSEIIIVVKASHLRKNLAMQIRWTNKIRDDYFKAARGMRFVGGRVGDLHRFWANFNLTHLSE